MEQFIIVLGHVIVCFNIHIFCCYVDGNYCEYNFPNLKLVHANFEEANVGADKDWSSLIYK